MISYMREALLNTDLYTHPMRIIDTDYDNFLIFYSCRDEERDPNEEVTPSMADFLIDSKELFGYTRKQLLKQSMERHMDNDRFIQFQDRLLEDLEAHDFKD